MNYKKRGGVNTTNLQDLLGDNFDQNSHRIDSKKTKNNKEIKNSKQRNSIRGQQIIPNKNKDELDTRKKRISHFFPLSGDWVNCAGYEIEGVFEMYTECLNKRGIIMSSPTLFAPMIAEVIKFADHKFKKNPLNYTVMMILTDGVIHDMEDTIEQLVKGSKTALSIIIVGIGTENFEFMKILDSDRHALKDKYGRKTVRDIVQFVDYSQFQSQSIVKNMGMKFKADQERKTKVGVKDINKLADEVLHEIPQQISTFYSMKGIKPSQFKVEKVECQLEQKPVITEKVTSLKPHSQANLHDQDPDLLEVQKLVSITSAHLQESWDNCEPFEQTSKYGSGIRVFRTNNLISSLNNKFLKPKAKVRFQD